MKVTLIKHSALLIELDQHLLLFDYYGGPLTLNKDKPLYIFSSHSHYDHYNDLIFSIDHPNIHYILSNDINTNHEACFVEPHKDYKIDDLSIHTLDSTDLGVAFIVKVEDQNIYHAGDLNNWYWEGEDENWLNDQHHQYLNEIKSIHDKMTISFVVVDQRLESHYLDGLREFSQFVSSQYIVPIHYFMDYSINERIKKEADLPPLILPTHNEFSFTI